MQGDWVGGVIFITIKLPPLPFWKLLHCQLPLPSPISLSLWRGSLFSTGSWSWLLVLHLSVSASVVSGSTFPPSSPPSSSLLLLKLRWLRHHLHPLNAVNMLHASLSAGHVQCTVLKVGGHQPLLLPLLPPYSLLPQLAKWVHRHLQLLHLSLFSLLPLSPLPSLLLHLHTHIHIHINVPFLKSIMLPLSL